MNKSPVPKIFISYDDLNDGHMIMSAESDAPGVWYINHQCDIKTMHKIDYLWRSYWNIRMNNNNHYEIALKDTRNLKLLRIFMPLVLSTLYFCLGFVFISPTPEVHVMFAQSLCVHLLAIFVTMVILKPPSKK